MERDGDWVAAVEAPAYEAEEAFDQRCVARGDDLSRLRRLETRIGDVLNTPFVSLMSQIALDFEMLI